MSVVSSRHRRTSTTTASGDATSFAWDQVGRMTGLSNTATGSQTDYTYSGGLRVSAGTTVGAGSPDEVSSTESFTWDTLAGVPLLLSDGGHEYIYGTGSSPVAQVDTVAGDVTFLHGDLVGSTRTATNASGAQVGTWDYTPFGVTTSATGGANSDGVGVTRFLFAGEYQDDSGLYFLRARFMDPVTASFLSIDPALSATGSPYAYASGNPLQLVDPLGLNPFGGLVKSLKSAVSSTVDLASAGLSATGNWISDHKSEIVSVVVGTIVFAGCSALLAPESGPLGIAACGALSGAISSMVTHAMDTPKDCWTVGGFFRSGAEGAAYGFAFSFAGATAAKAAAPLVSRVVSSVAARATPAVRNALSKTVSALGPRAATAETAADDALAIGRTTGAASELNAGGQVFTDISTGGADRVLHPAVQEALDAVPTALRAPWHGACAEMGCLSQALEAGVEPAGGSIRSVAIGTSNPGHALPKVACSSCLAVLEKFGVSS